MGGDGGGGQGGFGGLGIGNPGSYGGQKSTTAPGFGGGYSSNPFSGLTDKLGSIPKFVGTTAGTLLTGNLPIGLAIGYLVDKGLNSDFASNLMSGVKSGSITPQQAEQAAAKELGLQPTTFSQPPTQDQAIDSFIKAYHPGTVLGPDRLDVENTIKGFLNNTHDRGTREDKMAQDLVSQIKTITDPKTFEDGNTVTTDFTNDPTISPATPGTDTGDETMDGTPFTLTMEDLVKDPRFAMYKNAGQEQFGLARDRIMEQMPQGGQLLDQLAGVETDKARYMTGAFGDMAQDIVDKQYGTDLAKMGANVSLSAQSTQRDIAEDAQMNQMMTMIGYGLASK